MGVGASRERASRSRWIGEDCGSAVEGSNA